LARAISLFRLGADGENSAAFINLAKAYHNGNGIARDLVISYMWLELAESSGEQVAEAKHIVASELAQEEIAQAIYRADDWMRAHSNVPQPGLTLLASAK